MFITFTLAGGAVAAQPKAIVINAASINSMVRDNRGGTLLNVNGHAMNLWVAEELDLVSAMLVATERAR